MNAQMSALPVKDEAFWAAVVARWSGACENIVALRNDLERAHVESEQNRQYLDASRLREQALVRERDQLARELEQYRELSSALLKKKEELYQSQAKTFDPGEHSTIPQGVAEDMRTKLHDAEEGLNRAKHEYLRIKEQLSKSGDQLQHKDNEVAALVIFRDQLQEANRQLTEEVNRLRLELDSTKTTMEKQLRQLHEISKRDQEERQSLLSRNLELTAELERRQQLNSSVSEAERELRTLFPKIETLKSVTAADKQANAALRDELTSAREKLNKLNESNKSLVDNNKMLLENFTKLNESLKLRDSTLAASASQRNNSSISFPSKTEPNLADAQDNLSRIRMSGSRIFICPPTDQSPRTNRAVSITTKTIFAQPKRHTSSALSSKNLIPKARQQNIAQLADYVPDVDRTGARFRRALLASAIGGGIQSLIVRVTQSQTALAKSRDISMYLCPSLELNPWCPATPGQHGYMFVGLGQEKDMFREPHTNLNVFIGTSRSSGKPKDYRYLGVYTAVRVAGLNVDEWNSLSDEVKTGYATATKDKNKDTRTLEEIRIAYDTSELSVPCVLLQCTSFDETLYDALVAAQSSPSPPRPVRAHGKRRRDETEDFQLRTRKSTIRHELEARSGSFS